MKSGDICMFDAVRVLRPFRLPGGHIALWSHPSSLLLLFLESCFAPEGELACECLNAAICCFLKDF